ncbi:Ger(x)C family spore germination protein [Metabacillus arenae]|uniref:Ger(X)C family spore germination protein n=1 Tax=Metabacillus arenae TaxID=2771434 RepID=A0A926NMM8_9BACI|nr:Ger(x)C family spore germination protein [Metabacillus arenae]MBD1383505.1 Ger(x)C family spore germination protein [Metabacillus arenae]
MKKKRIVFMLFSLSLLLMTGCWDSIELNDQAIVLGIGADLTEDGNYQLSAQVVLPSSMGSSESGGGQGKQFYVATEKGATYYEAFENLQAKISRRLNRGQKQSVYIGERLAEHGIRDIIDSFTRDPDARVMGDISVVKGHQALDALKISDPLESASALASLKIHEQKDIAANTRLLDFLVVNARESMSPSPPALGLEQDQNALKSVGSAILNKNLKLVGFLNEGETKDKMWVLGNLSYQDITASIPQGKGKINLRTTNLKSKIQPMINPYKAKFKITLTGEGEVRLNNTNFDLTKPDKVEIMEHELEKYFEKRVSQLIKKVQKEYKTDIFGFGDAIFRKDPSQWKKIKNEWGKEFSEADISVKVDLTIHLIGMTGTSEQH